MPSCLRSRTAATSGNLVPRPCTPTSFLPVSPFTPVRRQPSSSLGGRLAAQRRGPCSRSRSNRAAKRHWPQMTRPSSNRALRRQGLTMRLSDKSFPPVRLDCVLSILLQALIRHTVLSAYLTKTSGDRGGHRHAALMFHSARRQRVGSGTGQPSEG